MTIEMKEKLGITFGNLLGFFQDQKEIHSFVRNIWQQNYFTLFKTLIELHTNSDAVSKPVLSSVEFKETDFKRVYKTEDVFSSDQTPGQTTDTPVEDTGKIVDIDVYYGKYIHPAIEAVDKNKFKLLEDYLKTCDNEKVDVGCGMDFIELLDETNTRLVNPNINDVCPDIVITEDVMYERALTRVGCEHYYGKIPVITVHPGVSAQYRYEKLSEMMYKITPQERRKIQTAPVVEISRKSIAIDMARICESGWDPETRALNDAGIEILKNTIDKYTDITVPMIFLSLRLDNNLSEEFLSETYDWFANHCQSAIQTQKYMRLIVTTLFKNVAGKALVLLNSMSNSVSSIELFATNSYSHTMLVEIMAKNLGCEGIDNYLDYMDVLPPAHDTIIENIAQEKRAYKRVISMFSVALFEMMVSYINLNGRYNDRLRAEVENIARRLYEAAQYYKDNDHMGHSSGSGLSVYTTRCELLYLGLSKDVMTQLMDDIYKGLNLVNPNDVIAKGPYSNRLGLSPTTATMDPHQYVREIKSLQKCGLASESAELVLETLRNGTSNAAIRKIETSVSNIDAFEKLIGIEMECALLEEASSLVNSLKADAIQFKTIVSNTRAACESERNKIIKKSA
jgi:hypothetical protein